MESHGERMRPRRFLAVLALLVAVALALPTFAAPLGDPVGDGVSVVTTNSTNAEYVRVTGDGELTLDLATSNPALSGAGVNAEAVTYIDDAFRVRYDGDRFASVWLTTEADGIAFRARGARLGSRADAIRLNPNGSASVGVVVDTTTGTPPEDASFSVEARVAEAGDVTDGTASSGGTGGSTGDGSGEETLMQVEHPSATSRTVTVENAVVGRPNTAAMDRLVVDREGDGVVTLDELTVVGQSTLEMDVSVTEPDAAGPLPASTSMRPVGAVRVEERRGTVDQAIFRFAVDRAYLAATGVDPESLTLYRYDGSERSELDVEVVGRSGGDVFLEADTPGLSTFVIAAAAPSIRVEAAELRPATVTPDERTTVTATVTNDGRVAGERTVALTLDGDVVGERRVTLAPDESAQVTFRVRAPGGTHDVRVGAADAGRLVVEGATPDGGATPVASNPAENVTETPPAVSPEAADTPAVSTDEPVAEPAGGSLPATAAFVAGLLALLVLMALARRVRR